MASINPAVEVRGHESFDSMPNLIISDAARSNSLVTLMLRTNRQIDTHS